MTISKRCKSLLLGLAIVIVSAASARMHADNGMCGGTSITLPFTDVMSNPFFCQIAEAYFTGLTNGTSATTYSPSDPVLREQMAAFVTRTLDQSLKRGNRRAALNQFWTTTPLYSFDLGVTNLGSAAHDLKSDGIDIWVAEESNSHVSRIRASDGKGLDFWTLDSGFQATAVLCALGRVFVAARGPLDANGRLYMIDPTATSGLATLLTSMLGSSPESIAFDGHRIWLSNLGGSIQIVTRSDLGGPTWNVTNITGFNTLQGILYDGANIWVAEYSPGVLKKLDGDGNVLLAVTVGDQVHFPVFDGRNIWVPCLNSVTVVRASDGTALATLSGNGVSNPRAVAFDGERILVTNGELDEVSLWKATDLTPLGNFSTGSGTIPLRVCSDGQYFWIGLLGTHQLARF